MVTRYSVTRHCEWRLKAPRSNLIFVMMFFLFGCSSASLSPTPAPASEIPPLPDTPTPAPDYVTQLRNAEYQLGLTDALQVVQLSDGKFEQGVSGGADFISVNITDYVSRGDLNNDGVDEVAAMVAENYGGSGVFVFLAVFKDVGGTLEFLSSVMVDDRPILNELSIQEGRIFLSAITHAIDDPMCCPTLQTARHYTLAKNDQLDMTDYATFTPDGRPRTITIDSPADYTEVFNSVQIKGSVDIAPFENNLTYRIVDVGGVELAIGSITVTASELGGPGTFDANISLGDILSGVTIRIEVQDISAKNGSLLGMDSVQLVVK